MARHLLFDCARHEGGTVIISDMPVLLPKEIRIRHALPSDIDNFPQLRLEALKNHPDAFGMDHAGALMKGPEYWEKVLQPEPNEKALFLAVQDERLAGMAGIYRNQAEKAKHGANIWGVYVRPQWRGNHISEALVEACLQWAGERSIVIVKLAVVTGNLPALRSYTRCGFTAYGTEPKALFYDGRYIDECLMSIELKELRGG